MIHERLNLTRPFIVFDTETTSANPKAARIVEISFELYTSEGLQKSWRSLVNPGVPIPEASTKVHGIDDARMLRCRVCDRMPPPSGLPLEGDLRDTYCTCDTFKPIPTFNVLAQSLAHGFTGCDFGGKRIRFDLQVLEAEMKRANVPWSYAGAHIIDVDRLEQLGEPRTLTHLYKKHTGKDLEGAHGASNDVAATIEVLAAQMHAYADVLPQDVAALHRLQWPDWLDSEGKFRMVDGVPTCAFGNKYRDVPMDKIPRDFYDWMLRSDFPDDVKALCRQAKLGIYPQAEI